MVIPIPRRQVFGPSAEGEMLLLVGDKSSLLKFGHDEADILLRDVHVPHRAASDILYAEEVNAREKRVDIDCLEVCAHG